MTGSDKANPTDGIIGYVCPVGHYCPEGAVIETTCARGYYSPMTGLGKKQTLVLYTHGMIRKFSENSYHFYILLSIELEIQHIIL